MHQNELAITATALVIGDQAMLLDLYGWGEDVKYAMNYALAAVLFEPGLSNV